MMRKHIAIALAALVAVVRMIEARPPDATSREITVTVSIRAWDTGPVAGWFLYLHDARDTRSGITDEAGVITFKTAVSDAEHRVRINGEGDPPASWTVEAKQRQIDSYNLLHTSYYFPYFNVLHDDIVVDLQPGQSEYRVDLVAQPAITARAVVVDSNRGVPVTTGLVYRRDASENLRFGSINRRGEMVAPGMPPGRANEVYLCVLPFVYPFPLSVEQTTHDVDLGKVQIDYLYNEPAMVNVKRITTLPATSLEFLDIRGTGYEEARALLNPRLGVFGMLLVSAENNGIIISLATDLSGRAGQEFKQYTEWPEIPAGDYYVVPGAFRAMDFQVAAIDAIRAGHDLSQWGIPKFTIEGGDKPQQFAFDAAETAKAVQKMMKALTPATQPQPSPMTTQPATQPASPAR